MKMETVSLHDVYRLIAGHSDYHGDDILSALTCIAEGKEVSPIRPMDVVSAGAYEQVAWERDLAVQQLKDYGVGLGQAKDLAEVTRCKNCEYGDWDSKPDDAMVCLRTNDGFWRTGNDFCSRGVPKEEIHEDH